MAMVNAAYWRKPGPGGGRRQDNVAWRWIFSVGRTRCRTAATSPVFAQPLRYKAPFSLLKRRWAAFARVSGGFQRFRVLDRCLGRRRTE